MNGFAVRASTRLVDTHARLIDRDDLLVDGALKVQGRHVQLRVGPGMFGWFEDPCQTKLPSGTPLEPARWSAEDE